MWKTSMSIRNSKRKAMFLELSELSLLEMLSDKKVERDTNATSVTTDILACKAVIICSNLNAE